MNPQTHAKRTLLEVRQWFFNEGIAVTDWARDHGFRPEAVYALLSGRTRGNRGQAHRAAVALGLKNGPAGIKSLPVVASTNPSEVGLPPEEEQPTCAN